MAPHGHAVRLLLLVLAVLSSLAPADLATIRKRKEFRELSKNELKLFVHGLSVMRAVGTETGKRLYGPLYKEYDHFLVKHIITTKDPRGDQGHVDVCFLTFHRALALEFELALLSVVPALKAMPYWNFLHDLRGGKYFMHPTKYMFSPSWAGSLTGDPQYNYTVTDGLLAWQPVSRWIPTKWGNWSAYWAGNEQGLNRVFNNSNPFLTRYPKTVTADVLKQFVPGGAMMILPQWQDNEIPLNYTAKDFNRCLDAKLVPKWSDWLWCVEYNAWQSANWTLDRTMNELRASMSSMFHGTIHALVGGHCNATFCPHGLPTPLLGGDFVDVSASPNELILFMGHHANVDRAGLMWQASVAKANRSMATRQAMWGYPRSKAEWQWGNEGCFLDDVATSATPFTDIFPGVKPSKAGGYTHADIIWNTRPGAAPYTYDDMKPAV
eukprot:CAMPEP_0202863950 /NCGR_PEP_ID=MMETSP1391-20130828/4382_1 /ASSEMBLY_ACC=CAM_ASM_000867 /TAXON_ID=1034604 /ORGANISM="Chlamydomonas leiostraca, Strain SAG 11-49" /LENGTH=436 /DNA_ID=CAMNT_0049543641 /DNA_START=102 /DNA_END=1412 /DNA_ORIENTATION=+